MYLFLSFKKICEEPQVGQQWTPGLWAVYFQCISCVSQIVWNNWAYFMNQTPTVVAHSAQSMRTIYAYYITLAVLLASGQHFCSAYAFLASWECLQLKLIQRQKDILQSTLYRGTDGHILQGDRWTYFIEGQMYTYGQKDTIEENSFSVIKNFLMINLKFCFDSGVYFNPQKLCAKFH